MSPAGMQALLLTCALASTGCGVTILGSYPLDMPFLRAHNETITSQRALSPPQTSARYTLASGPMRVVCQTETAVPEVEIARAETFDGTQRMLVGFVALAESATAFLLPGRDAIRTGDAGSWVVFGVVQADALFALGYAALAPSRTKGTTEVVQGVTTRDATCPPGLVVVTGNQSFPVDPAGRIPNGALAAGRAVEVGAAIAAGGRFATWRPAPPERCELARESGHPSMRALCTGAPARPPILPPLARPGIPDTAQWNGSLSLP